MARRGRKKKQAVVSPIQRTTVENPDWAPARDGEPGFPRYIAASINTRESAVETLFSRGKITETQKKAADKFREVWESAGGRASSLDYTADRVDGGKGDPIVTGLMAAQELNRCRDLLGDRLYRLIVLVCGQGMALSEIGATNRDKTTAADNLRASLDDLATMWGYSTRQRNVLRKSA